MKQLIRIYKPHNKGLEWYHLSTLQKYRLMEYYGAFNDLRLFAHLHFKVQLLQMFTSLTAPLKFESLSQHLACRIVIYELHIKSCIRKPFSSVSIML